MKFKDKKLTRIIKNKNRQFMEFCSEIDYLANKQNLIVDEETFEYLKSIIISYKENRWGPIIMDVVNLIFKSLFIAIMTVIVNLFMSILKASSDFSIGMIFFGTVFLCFVLGFIESIKFNKFNYKIGPLKDFTYSHYMFLKGRREKNQLEKN